MSQLVLNYGAAVPGTPATGKGYLYSSNQAALSTVNVDGVTSQVDVPRRNWLRNSGFWFAQRYNPTAVSTVNVQGPAIPTTDFFYGPDGWTVGRNLADVTYQRGDTSASPETGIRSRYYGKFIKITNAGKMQISQREGEFNVGSNSGDACALRGRTVRLTMYLKSISANVTWRMGMTYNDASNAATFAWGANSTDPTLTAQTAITPTAGQTGDGCTIAGTAATITGLSTTTWTRVSCLFTLPTSTGSEFYWRVMLWSDSALAIGNGIAIAQTSLTDGYEIPAWPHDAVAIELERCQAFFQKTFGVDQIPAQNVGINTGELQGIAGKAGAVANAFALFHALHTPMLSAATLTLTTFNPAAANALIRDEAGSVDSGAIATATANQNYWIVVIATGNAASVVGSQIGCHLTIDGDYQ